MFKANCPEALFHFITDAKIRKKEKILCSHLVWQKVELIVVLRIVFSLIIPHRINSKDINHCERHGSSGGEKVLKGKGCCNNTSYLFTYTKVISALSDNHERTLVILCVFALGAPQILTSSFSSKTLYKIYMESSAFICVTDSWGFRLKYHDECWCSQALLFTHRQGWKEQILLLTAGKYFMERSCVFWHFCYPSSSFELLVQKRF